MRLYHYCSANSFEKIIASKEIRLSDISKSNDSGELKYMLTYIRESINAAFDKEKTKYFWDRVNMKSVNSLIEEFIKGLEELANNTKCYVLCFSEEPDLLSQWRGYSNDGKGYAIGVEREKLEYFAKNNNIGFNRVEYDKRKQKAKARMISNSIIVDIKKKIQSEKEVLLDDLLINIFNEYKKDFLILMVNSKSGFFKEEKEWRLYCYEEDIEFQSDYFFSDDDCRKYITISLEKIVDESKIDIRLGPKNKANKCDIEDFVYKCGFSCTSKTSEGTYV